MTDEEFAGYEARVRDVLSRCNCDDAWPNQLCAGCAAITARYMEACAERTAVSAPPAPSEKRRYQVASRRDPHGLTRREREIATQLYEGLTVREVSVALAMQYETVRTHLKNIRRKLGVHSLLAVVAVLRKAEDQGDARPV